MSGDNPFRSLLDNRTNIIAVGFEKPTNCHGIITVHSQGVKVNEVYLDGKTVDNIDSILVTGISQNDAKRIALAIASQVAAQTVTFEKFIEPEKYKPAKGKKDKFSRLNAIQQARKHKLKPF